MKKINTITKIIALFAFSLIAVSVMSSDNTYAANNWNDCMTGGGYISVSSIHISNVGGLAGGSAYGGGQWACSNLTDHRAIMFIASSVSKNDPYYTIYTDVNVDLSSEYNYAIAMGMVHTATGTNYAVNIGYCRTSSCSSGQTADGIIPSFSSSITRMNSSNQPQSRMGNWTPPKHTSSSIRISGPKLNQYWNSLTKSNLGSGYYLITLYQYRCWSNNGRDVTGTCSTNPVYLLIWKDEGWSTTFSGKVDSSPSGLTKASDNKYYTDSGSVTVNYSYYMARNNNGPDSNVSNNWYAYDTNGSYYDSGTKTAGKNSGWGTAVKTQSRTYTLSYGDNTFCEYIGYYTTVTNNGVDGNSWTSNSGCVTIHRYYWYEFDGQVIPKVNSTNKTNGSTTWIDGNSANLQFVHQLQRKTTANVQTRYHTSKNPTISTAFGYQANWTDSSINVNNSWYSQYTSGSPTSVNIEKSDNGSTYCQTLNFWRYVRESVNWSNNSTYNTDTTKSACVTLKRYKTNFTGGTTVTVNGSTPTNGTVNITNNGVPTIVPVVFTHTITRTQEDTPPSAPGNKSSTIAVSTTGTTGCRSGDPCGTAIAEKQTTELPRTGTDAQRTYTETQSFNVKIYPDQTITVCQQMTYTYRRWGSDWDKTSSDRVCVTMHMDKASCTDGATSQYGVHDGRNYGSLTIFKNINNGTDTSTTSGVKDTGTTAISVWAKPGDNINFRHESCAAADLSNQFNNKGVTVKYDVSASKAGYLFGKSIGSDPYTSTSANLGTTNSTPGTGPFSGGKYTITYRSPSISSPAAGDMYSCSGSYDNDHKAKNNYYQITSNVKKTNSLSSSDCKSYAKTVPSGSTTYAIGSDVGSSFYQKLEWNDLWIASDTVNPSHNGRGKASITGTVYVPYNYYLHPYVSVGSGSVPQTVVPGSQLSAQVYIPVVPRENRQVGETYATHTKATKIRVVSFTLREGQPKNSLSYLSSNDGTLSGDGLCSAAKSSGQVVSGTCVLQNTTSSNRSYVLNASTKNQLYGTATTDDQGVSILTTSETNDAYTLASSSGSSVQNITVTIPESGIRVGDKVCVAVAAWPSDSHNNINSGSVINSTNQSIALSDSAGSGAKWVVSAPLCSTIAKNPSFSVEGSQLTTAGPVETSRSKFGGRNYDSWVEYGLLAGDNVKNMSSGAASAYISAQSLVSNSASLSTYILGMQNVNRDSTSSGTKNGSSTCLYTAQTYLSGGVCTNPGNFDVASAENINNILDRVRDVYTRKAGSTYHPEAGIDSFNNLSRITDASGTTYATKITVNGTNYYDVTPRTTYACEYDEELGFYRPDPEDAQRGVRASDNARIAPFYCLPNGSKYYYVNGNAYIGGRYTDNNIHSQYINYVDDLVNAEGQETYRNQTQIFHVTGTIVIDTNFVTDRNYKIGNSYHLVDVFDDIQQIPQIIIIADKVYFTSKVSRVDAWIVADGSHGTLNTCAYENYSTFLGGHYIKDPGNRSILDARKCDRAIMFNGPVFAKSLILNRTAGGGTQTLSWNGYWGSTPSLAISQNFYAQRGEIFNLRSDVYLWGYYQAQRNGILTTVFTQELPTRY